MAYDEKVYQIALHFVPGIGNVVAKTLVSYCSSASKIFNTPPGKLSKIPGIGQLTADKIKNFGNFDKAEQEWHKCTKQGIDILFYSDPKYPKRLKQCADAPILLFYKGQIPFNNEKVLAIVGTRQATSYGRDFLDELFSGLASHQPLLISGLAYGIDIYAHKKALDYNIPTVGVMGSGLDVIYPSAHKKYIKPMLANGGIVSEHFTGVVPDAHHFPARNRIIAGMADATIVIEAAEKGGALITADIANSYDREVFAVPGNYNAPYSKGCNNLIKKHKANILTSVEDIEYLLNWQPGQPVAKKPGPASVDMKALSVDESNIVKTILDCKNDILLDDLSWKTQIPINQIAANLLNLEFKGIVKSLPGKRYKVN